MKFLITILMISVCVTSLTAYIFSFSYANRLLALGNKIMMDFETKAQTYRYLHNNLIQYGKSLQFLLEAFDNHERAEDCVSNPIYAFKLIKVLSIDFEELKHRFENKHTLDFSHVMEETITSNGLTFPSVKDLRGVCEAILRLQDIYDIDETDILSGNFQNYWNGSLTESDLKELRNCYQYHKALDVREWLSSEVDYGNENEITDLLLVEQFKALKVFSTTSLMTTLKLLQNITQSRTERYRIPPK